MAMEFPVKASEDKRFPWRAGVRFTHGCLSSDYGLGTRRRVVCEV